MKKLLRQSTKRVVSMATGTPAKHNKEFRDTMKRLHNRAYL